MASYRAQFLWTEENTKALKANWSSMTVANLAVLCGCSRYEVQRKGAELDLPKKGRGHAPGERQNEFWAYQPAQVREPWDPAKYGRGVS